MAVSPVRAGAPLVPAGVGGALAYALLSGLGLGTAVSVALAIALSAAAASWLAVRLPAGLDVAARRNPLLAAAWLALGLAAVGATARLARFMVDETKAELSMLPFDEFFVHHSCLSAHYRSAMLHREGVANVYDGANFEGPNGEPKFLRSFVVDVFIYPPPFLLLSRLALALSEDFAVWRAVWFALEGALVMAALVAVALSLDGAVGRRALLLSPLVWLSAPVLTTLQIGNFHLVAIAGAVLAMLLLERGRHAPGGAVLAFLALGKIFPGILVLLLVFQRRWRSVAWVCAFGLVWLALAFLLLGRAPFAAMVSYNLPRLASGAAVESQFAHPDAIAASHAVFGLFQKLDLLGVPGMSRSTSIRASWLYTAALPLFAALGARSAKGPWSRAVVWLALLQLASLRSPFTPDTYAKFPLLWIVVLLLARVERKGWRPAALIGLLVFANYIVPTVPIMPVPALLALSVVDQIVFFALCAAVLLEARDGPPASPQPHHKHAPAPT